MTTDSLTARCTLPDRRSLKTQAKRLRAALAAEGDFITHSESLELVARQYGYRDWNTLHAAAPARTLRQPYQVGDRVTGRYLGQRFTGVLLAVQRLAGGARHDLTLEFDAAVDVVRFDSFSSYRKRISARVNAEGLSDARTSDGAPHLVLDR